MEELIKLYYDVNLSFNKSKLFTISKHLSFYELYGKDLNRLDIDFQFSGNAEDRERIASRLIKEIKINNSYLSELNLYIQQSNVDREIKNYKSGCWSELEVLSQQIANTIRKLDEYEKQSINKEILPEEYENIRAILNEEKDELDNKYRKKHDEVVFEKLTPLQLCGKNIIPKLIEKNEDRITFLNKYLLPTEKVLQFFDCFELSDFEIIANIFLDNGYITGCNKKELIQLLMGDRRITVNTSPKCKTKVAVIIWYISSKIIESKEKGKAWGDYMLDVCGVSKSTAITNSLEKTFNNGWEGSIISRELRKLSHKDDEKNITKSKF